MESIKQVIIIRKDLGMRKGKMIAQGAHASMKVFFDKGSTGFTWRTGDTGLEFQTEDDLVCPFEVPNHGDPALLINLTTEMKAWFEGIFTKIVVGCNSEEELLTLRDKAQEAHLPYALIQDVGLTEFGGVPTFTALAIGPDTAERIDPITGHLTLL